VAKKKAEKPAEKRAVGRPRTTVEDLPEGWQNIMRDIAQDGGSAVECQARLGIYHSAWETLLADSEDFRETVRQCKVLCQVWWEKVGREMAAGLREGNATVWIFNMKNRFDWRDKTEVSSDPNAPFQVETNKKDLSDEEVAAICQERGLPLLMYEKVIDHES